MRTRVIVNINQAASGSPSGWSFNTEQITYGYLELIILKAATVTTSFDFSILDDASNIVYDTTEGNTPTGTLRDSPGIPMEGIYTVVVTNSEVDEVYTGRLIIGEG